VEEIRRFRPQVILTFEPGGLSGHKDHIAISRHTTTAYQRAGDPAAFPEHLRQGLEPYTPQRLFYTARPQGYRLQRALTLRQAGIDTPLPPPELQQLGVPPEAIHLTLDVSAYIDTKIASMRCHRSQISPEWERLYTTHPAVTELLGTEYFIRAHPSVSAGEVIAADLFAGVTE
jgi:LmbE family N-acetylglucosaminyl deacetylase